HHFPSPPSLNVRLCCRNARADTMASTLSRDALAATPRARSACLCLSGPEIQHSRARADASPNGENKTKVRFKGQGCVQD
ncbi:hypothetical protein XENOCAPTIV_013080, partial [Xenoophorus captivus]